MATLPVIPFLFSVLPEPRSPGKTSSSAAQGVGLVKVSTRNGSVTGLASRPHFSDLYGSPLRGSLTATCLTGIHEAETEATFRGYEERTGPKTSPDSPLSRSTCRIPSPGPHRPSYEASSFHRGTGTFGVRPWEVVLQSP